MALAAPTTTGTPGPRVRTLVLLEVALVLGLSLGRSGVYAAVDLVAAATAPGRLSGQAAVLNGSLAPGRPWLDLTLQLLGIGFGLVAAGLAAYLLHVSGRDVRALWLGRGHRVRDLLRGLVVAAVVGGTGLAFYLVTFHLGVDATVVAAGLPHVWWAVPVLVLSALQNAVLEETVVIGYVLVRLDEIGVRRPVAVVLAAVLRGSYHLYQGLGGFLGNAAMGLLFGHLYHRWGRVTSLVVAHTVLDVVAFVGFTLLAGHVGWLPS